jgi:hypothetical protein
MHEPIHFALPWLAVVAAALRWALRSTLRRAPGAEGIPSVLDRASRRDGKSGKEVRYERS